MLEQLIHQLEIGHVGPGHFELTAVVLALPDDGVAITLDRDAGDTVLIQLFDELRIAHLLHVGLDAEVVEHRQQHGRDDQPEDQVLGHIVQGNVLDWMDNRPALRWHLPTRSPPASFMTDGPLHAPREQLWISL